MRKRAYVLIFSFWAFLTIITPTLIQWSAAAASAATAAQAQPTANITDNYNSSEGSIKSRRMLVPFDGINMGSKAPPPLPLSPVASPPSLSPAVQPLEQAERLQPEFAAEHRNIRSREVKGIL